MLKEWTSRRHAIPTLFSLDGHVNSQHCAHVAVGPAEHGPCFKVLWDLGFRISQLESRRRSEVQARSFDVENALLQAECGWFIYGGRYTEDPSISTVAFLLWRPPCHPWPHHYLSVQWPRTFSPTLPTRSPASTLLHAVTHPRGGASWTPRLLQTQHPRSWPG